jgi:diguanylate cyclase (GGDEF)-like protein
VLDVLWAGVDLVPAGGVPAQAAALALPDWSLDFHVIDLKELCRKFVLELPRRLGFRDASLYLYDVRHGLLKLAETTLTRAIDLTVPVDATDRRLMAVVAREGKILRAPQAGLALAARGIAADAARGYVDDECLVAPLLSGGRLWGVLNVSGRVSDAGDEPRADPQTLFAFLGRALHHACIYEQARVEARVDGLTGLYNQRWMAEALGKEIRRAQRYGTSLSILMVDVDELKVVNDGIGHGAGDALLRHTASRISAILRRFDGAARVGGDEFVIMLPATDLKGAQQVGQRLIRGIHEDVAQYQSRPLPTTVSVGAAEWRPGWDTERLLKAADGALYRAKRHGRNRLASAAQRRSRSVRLGQPPGLPSPTPTPAPKQRPPAAPIASNIADARAVLMRPLIADAKDQQAVVQTVI